MITEIHLHQSGSTSQNNQADKQGRTDSNWQATGTARKVLASQPNNYFIIDFERHFFSMNTLPVLHCSNLFRTSIKKGPQLLSAYLIKISESVFQGRRKWSTTLLTRYALF